MRPSVLLAVLLVASVSVVVLPPSRTRAATVSAPHLFITTSPIAPLEGQTVTIDVYTFQGPTAADADSGPDVSVQWPGGTRASVVLTGAAVGHYEGQLTLPDVLGCPCPTDAPAYVTASAVVGGVGVNGTQRFDVNLPGPSLQVVWNATLPAPGQWVHVAAHLSDGSGPADASNAGVQFEIRIGPTLAYTVPGNRTSVGVYEADFRTPANDASTGYLRVHALADYGGTSLEAWVPSGLLRYQVWYHAASETGGTVQGEVWVAEPDGRPAASVPLNLTVVGAQSIPVAGSTDAQGRFLLAIPYAASMPATISGIVGSGDPLSTPIEIHVPVPATLTPGIVTTDPTVLADGSPRDFLPANSRVVRHFQDLAATTSGVAPIPGASILYYVVAPHEPPSAGQVVTDANGAFEVSFLTPAEDFEIQFEAPGGAPPQAIAYQVAAPFIGFKAGPVVIGGTTNVSVVLPSPFAGLRDEGIWWAGVEVTEFSATCGDAWSASSPSGPAAYVFLNGFEGNLTGTAFLPSFLPKDAAYLVDLASGEAYRTLGQFELLPGNLSASIPNCAVVAGIPGSGANSGVLLVAAGVVVVAAVGAVGLWARRRRKRTPP